MLHTLTTLQRGLANPDRLPSKDSSGAVEHHGWPAAGHCGFGRRCWLVRVDRLDAVGNRSRAAVWPSRPAGAGAVNVTGDGGRDGWLSTRPTGVAPAAGAPDRFDVAQTLGGRIGISNAHFPVRRTPSTPEQRDGTQRPKRLEPVFGCRLRCVGRGLLNRSSRKASFLALFTG